MVPRLSAAAASMSGCAAVASRARMFVGSLPDGDNLCGHSLPEGGIEGGIDIAGEFLPLRIEGLELRSGHARILRGIHTAAVFEGDSGEAVEQIKADFGPDGEVERKSNAGRGEGHHAGRRDLSEDLDDGEERCEAGRGDGLENLDDAKLVGFPRQHALKLQQAILAVHAVPVKDLVERIEERLVVDEAAGGFAELLVVVEGVEESDGEMIQGEAGQIDGKYEPGLLADSERRGLG